MIHRLGTGILTAILLVVAGAGAPAQSMPEVFVNKAKTSFAFSSRTGSATHSFDLKGQAIPAQFGAGFDPDLHLATLALGGVELLRHDPLQPSSQVRCRTGRKLKVSAKGGTGSRLRLTLDTRNGKLRIKLRKANLTGLRVQGPQAVPVSLDLGGSEATAAIDFRVQTGRKEKWSYAAVGSAGGGGNGGGGDPGGEGGGEIPDLPLGNMSLLGVLNGTNSGITSETQRVARTQAQWNALWNEHDVSGAPQPAVDFTTKMVLGVFLGTRTQQWLNEWSADIQVYPQNRGATVDVSWIEFHLTAPIDPNNPQPTVNSPFTFYTTDHHPGAVNWTKVSRDVIPR